MLSGTDYRARSAQGIGILLILVMMGVVAAVAGTLALRVQRSMQAGSEDGRSWAREDAAHSGLQVGLASVSNQGDSWSGTGGVQTLPQRTELAYQVVVNSNYSGLNIKTDSDGTEIPPEAIYVKSFGFLDGTALAGMSALVAQQRGMTFNYPAFGSSSLELTNSLVQAVDTSGNPAPGDAPIRTNSKDSGAIALRGGSYIDGDVTVGPGGDPAVALFAETGSGFSGDADTAGSELPLPTVAAGYSNSAPDVTAVNLPIPVPIPGLGLYFINQSIVVVPSGTYDTIDLTPSNTGRLSPELAHFSLAAFGSGPIYCNELLTTGSEPVTVNVSGPSLVHVRDRVGFDASSTAIQATGASDFQVYQTEPGGQVSLNQTQGRMVLASQNPVTATNSHISGALYGTSVSLTDSTLEYPKELDGQVLNDQVRGGWRLFGIKTMNPAELTSALP